MTDKTNLIQDHQQPDDERPPIFRNWNQVYAFVLLLHAAIILLFYLFTQAYS